MRKPILAAIALLGLALPLSAQQESVAEAARRAREQKRASAKPVRVLTNDDLAGKQGGLSLTGTEPAGKQTAEAKGADGKSAAGADKAKPEEKSETYWRKRFADARTKLHDAEMELDILQRELNQKLTQYYPDPTKGLQEQYTRKEVNDWRKKVEDKKQEIAQIRQSISDLEDELRRAGGDPGWARE